MDVFMFMISTDSFVLVTVKLLLQCKPSSTKPPVCLDRYPFYIIGHNMITGPS